MKISGMKLSGKGILYSTQILADSGYSAPIPIPMINLQATSHASIDMDPSTPVELADMAIVEKIIMSSSTP
jgi:hypothetical protein